MGRRELQVKKVKIQKFDLGFYPNQYFNDVPDGGTSECQHVLYRRSALRPFPGIDRINSTQVLDLLGQGVHYMNVNGVQKRTAVFNGKFYEDVAGTWTDRTGAVSIPTTGQVQFIDHQLNANKYLIGFPGGGSPPFKWTGSGNAAALGGSPPNGTTGAKYHNLIYTAVNENVYFSGTGDPETWNTSKWVRPYEKDVVCLLEHGPKLAVLMDDHIGSMQGYDYLDLVAEEREIRTFGCVGKLAARNCHFGINDLKVIATIARDGLWAFDEGFNGEKIFGDNYFKEFNKSQLSKSSMAYWREEGLLFIALPYGTSIEPDYLIILNTKNGAFWPGPQLHGNYIRSLGSMKDDNGDEFIYFQDANGYAYKFNFDTIHYHTGSVTEKINYKWKSKIYDLENLYTFGELVVLAAAVGDYSVDIGVRFGLETGDGNRGSVAFNDTHDRLSYSFILGASVLGGSEYIFRPLEGIGGEGRFLQLTVLRHNNDVESTFNIHMMEAHLHDQRAGGDDK